MQRVAFPFALMFVLSACGGDSGSTSAANPTAAPSPTTQTSSNTPIEVWVVMGEMYFKPSMTTFKVGQPYTFVLVNEGKVPHEFTIAPPRKAGQNEADLHKLSLQDADQLEGGKTTTLDVFTFKDPPTPAGTLEFECSYPGHYEGGMHIPIVVEPKIPKQSGGQ
jgi:uncharacterized cupredoxin-like copper-binding protein